MCNTYIQKINHLLIIFKQEISIEEIPAFRGAICALMAGSNNVLYHNHIENGFRYNYPLIQYRSINNKGAIFCIGEGTNAIGEFFSNADFNINLKGKSIKLEVDSITANKSLIQHWDTLFTYKICRWLPLNQKNYTTYRQLDSLAEKYAMLERLLIANILSMGKGLNITFDKNIVCKIQTINRQHTKLLKGVKMASFDLIFKSNIYLPNWIGLGKSASHGFGTVTRNINKNKE